MKSLLDRYLDRVLLYANLPEAEATSVRRELHDHLTQKTADLIAAGTPHEDATIEALRQHGSPQTVGYGLRKPFPWIDIRARGTARGFIAIGPKAVGVIAMGGWAMGVFAFGGLACGIFSAGGFALGLLFAFAGFGIGGVAYGGFTIGLVAVGGYVIGLVAEGGEAIGLWVPHAGKVVSYYTSSTAPAWLKSMAVLLEIPKFMDRYMMIVWPLYGLGIFLMGIVQSREARRLQKDDTWLLDG